MAVTLLDHPPRGRTYPDQPYTMSLHFRSVASWRSAVAQYGAVVSYENQEGDGHFQAVAKFGDTDRRPFTYAGAELHLVHIADTE